MNLTAILDCFFDTKNLTFGKFSLRQISLKMKKFKNQERAKAFLADQFFPVLLKQSPWEILGVRVRREIISTHPFNSQKPIRFEFSKKILLNVHMPRPSTN